MLTLPETVEELDIRGNNSICPEDKEDSALNGNLCCIIVIVHDHQIHEDVAQQEEEPFPTP